MGAQKGQAFLSGNTLDGNWNQVKNEMANECVQQKLEKKRKAEEIAKTIANGEDECEVKVSPKAMVCHTKRES